MITNHTITVEAQQRPYFEYQGNRYTIVEEFLVNNKDKKLVEKTVEDAVQELIATFDASKPIDVYRGDRGAISKDHGVWHQTLCIAVAQDGVVKQLSYPSKPIDVVQLRADKDRRGED